ncbi:MAG: LptF/LptG family permease [Silvanigrellales bacterium]|nr:LptF/LptG family permease [Silvanigrellales bacterium]
MPFAARLYWYVTKEILSLTLIIMAALSSVMFLFRILAYADYIFVSEEGLLSVFMFILFLLPSIFKLTVPISLLLATMVVVLRMSSDRELEAWMSVGVSPVRIAVGPFFVGILVCGLSGFSALYLEPFSRQEWRTFKYMHARKSVESIIENRLQEKTFLSELFRTGTADIAFYVDKLSPNRRDFEGVFFAVTDKQQPYSMVLVAKEGTLQKEDGEGLTDYVLTLRNGRLYQPSASSGNTSLSLEDLSKGGSLRVTAIPTVTPTVTPAASPSVTVAVTSEGMAVNPPATSSGATPQPTPEPTPTPAPTPVPTPTPPPWTVHYQYPEDWSVTGFREMRVSLLNLFSRQFDPGAFDANDIRSLYPRDYIRELRKIRSSEEWGKNQRLVRDHSFFYEQIVVPLSCLLLPVIGVCLGIQDPRRKAGLAYLGIGLVVFVYYASIMTCQQLALRYVVPPEVTLVVPPVVLGLLTLLLLLWRMRYPPSVQFLEFLGIELRLRLGPLARRFGARKGER